MLAEEPSDPEALTAAVEAAAFLRRTKKPVLLIGSKLRAAGAEKEAVGPADALGCSVAVMAAAKSFFPEDHPQFVDTYWGEISTPSAQTIVDWSDGVVCIGTIFNDYSTVGWTAMPSGPNALTADQHGVYMAGHDFTRIHLRDFLLALARKVEKRDATMVEYRCIKSEPPAQVEAEPDAKLMRAQIVRQVRPLITSQTTLLVETGASWFKAMMMKLPNGIRFEIGMQWRHIGWSVPAAFGYALGAPGRRTIAMISDGSFQLTAQEVAQMIRQKLPVIIFSINNHGYRIEIELHDAPYNTIKSWDYAGLIQVINAEEGKGRGLRATNSGELAEAIKVGLVDDEGPTPIECVIDRDDCTSHLISWGRLVATANARPLRPQ